MEQSELEKELDFKVYFHDHVITSISRIIKEYGMPASTIEIGVFEGGTTFNMTNVLATNNPSYIHYAIDPFYNSDALELERIAEAKERFKSNLEKFKYKDNIKFIESESFGALMNLYKEGIKVDFVYVDGDHTAPKVLQDMVISFELLNKGGIMLLDDCVSWRFERTGDRMQDSPKLAVDNFIQCNWHRLKVMEMPNGYQTAIRKT